MITLLRIIQAAATAVEIGAEVTAAGARVVRVSAELLAEQGERVDRAWTPPEKKAGYQATGDLAEAFAAEVRKQDPDVEPIIIDLRRIITERPS